MTTEFKEATPKETAASLLLKIQSLSSSITALHLKLTDSFEERAHMRKGLVLALTIIFGLLYFQENFAIAGSSILVAGVFFYPLLEYYYKREFSRINTKLAEENIQLIGYLQQLSLDMGQALLAGKIQRSLLVRYKIPENIFISTADRLKQIPGIEKISKKYADVIKLNMSSAPVALQALQPKAAERIEKWNQLKRAREHLLSFQIGSIMMYFARTAYYNFSDPSKEDDATMEYFQKNARLIFATMQIFVSLDFLAQQVFKDQMRERNRRKAMVAYLIADEKNSEETAAPEHTVEDQQTVEDQHVEDHNQQTGAESLGSFEDMLARAEDAVAEDDASTMLEKLESQDHALEKEDIDYKKPAPRIHVSKAHEPMLSSGRWLTKRAPRGKSPWKEILPPSTKSSDFFIPLSDTALTINKPDKENPQNILLSQRFRSKTRPSSQQKIHLDDEKTSVPFMRHKENSTLAVSQAKVNAWKRAHAAFKKEVAQRNTKAQQEGVSEKSEVDTVASAKRLLKLAQKVEQISGLSEEILADLSGRIKEVERALDNSMTELASLLERQLQAKESKEAAVKARRSLKVSPSGMLSDTAASPDVLEHDAVTEERDAKLTSPVALSQTEVAALALTTDAAIANFKKQLGKGFTIKDEDFLRLAIEVIQVLSARVRKMCPDIRFKIFVFGGVLRDLLRGDKAKDVDLMTNLSYEDLMAAMKGFSLVSCEKSPLSQFQLCTLKFKNRIFEIRCAANLKFDSAELLANSLQLDLSNLIDFDINGVVTDEMGDLYDVFGVVPRMIDISLGKDKGEESIRMLRSSDKINPKMLMRLLKITQNYKYLHTDLRQTCQHDLPYLLEKYLGTNLPLRIIGCRGFLFAFDRVFVDFFNKEIRQNELNINYLGMQNRVKMLAQLSASLDRFFTSPLTQSILGEFLKIFPLHSSNIRHQRDVGKKIYCQHTVDTFLKTKMFATAVLDPKLLGFKKWFLASIISKYVPAVSGHYQTSTLPERMMPLIVGLALIHEINIQGMFLSEPNVLSKVKIVGDNFLLFREIFEPIQCQYKLQPQRLEDLVASIYSELVGYEVITAPSPGWSPSHWASSGPSHPPGTLLPAATGDKARPDSTPEYLGF